MKEYGDIAMPAGEYNALRITIGEGLGQNWWCVIYPNLCVSGNKAEFSSEARQILKENLTKEEYDLITGREPLRFRLLEMMNRE